MTDAYQHAGPVGRKLEAKTGLHAPSLCGSLAFDKAGQHRLDLPVDVRRPAGPRLRSEDARGARHLRHARRAEPARHAVLPELHRRRLLLPRRQGPHLERDQDEPPDGASPSATTAASWSRSPTTTSPRCSRDNQRITSALPDWQGRIWFVSKKDGVIGVLDTKTGKIETITLNEEIENSFAVDRDGVYIASDKRMYRFNAGKDNKPVADWKVTYKNSGITKPSQLNAGTGTTPTIFNHGKFVTITDNADPMNVVVYRTAKKLGKGEKRDGLRDPGLRQGRQRDRELDHRRRQLAVRREQLRLPGPVRPERRRPDDGGLRAHRRQPGRQAAARCAGRTRPRPCRPSSPSSRPRPA